MRKIVLSLILMIAVKSLYAQFELIADGPGSTYEIITGQGFQIESPDCSHEEFGRHVTETFDFDLVKNVFVFHSHIDEDDDRCINFDRVRMEIKAASGSPQGMLHTEGETAYYRWKFKLDEDFIGSGSFCHIFQIKAQGGDLDSPPLLTITPRRSTIEVIHGNDAGVYTDLDWTWLEPFLGNWIEVYVKYESSDTGTLDVSMTRVSDGAVLFDYSTTNIDMWRAGAAHNRGKWGVYRKKAEGLRDEQVRFADFCVTESQESLCPSNLEIAPIGCDPVRASADDGNGSVAANAIDDDLSTRWSAEGEGQWLLLCLEQDTVVSGLDIAFYLGDERQSYFDIETSVDGVNFTKVLENQASNGTSTALEPFPFSVPTSARYIKYLGQGNSSNSWASITEIDVLYDVTSSIKDHPQANVVALMPNPALDSELFVSGTTITSVRVRGARGETFIEKEGELGADVELTIEDLSPGLYTVEVLDRQTKYLLRFVKN